MCNCHDEMLEKVSKKLRDDGVIPEASIDVDIKWSGKLYRLDGNNSDPVPPRINFEYRNLKNDGTPYKNLTKSQMYICGSYCTFCGNKFD